jgi:hypothetical protein
MDPETPYLLPNGDRVWVLTTSEASKNLPGLLHLFRTGETEPLFFGDAGQPEGVIIPWELWRRLDELSTDEDGFDATYAVARERLANPQPSVPLEEVAAELGWDLNEPVDDSDLPKPR